MPEINRGLLKKLSTGKNKLLLSFSLCTGSDPINTFAHLAWPQESVEEGDFGKQCGFEFVDIPNAAFERIKKFVDSNGFISDFLPT